MAPGGLPKEVKDFLLVGRIVQRGSGANKETGVVNFHITKYGHGRQHKGMGFFYASDAGGKGTPMDTDFQYAVFWGDSLEPEMMSLEQVQRVASDQFTDETWLPAAIRTLIQDGWGDKWKALKSDNICKFLEHEQQWQDKAIKKEATAAAKARADPGTAGGSSKGTKAKPAAAPRKSTAAAKKEAAPLAAATGMGALLQANKEAKQRKAVAEAAAAIAAGSPAKPPKALTGKRAPASRTEAAAAAAAAAAATMAAAAAVAAAHVEPSSGLVSARDNVGSHVGAAGVGQKRKQQVQADGEDGVSSSSLVAPGPSGKRQNQQQLKQQAKATSVSRGKQLQTLLSPGGQAASGSRGKQQQVQQQSPAKGRLGTGAASGSKAKATPAKSNVVVPKVLLQHKNVLMAPADSALLLEERGSSERIPAGKGNTVEVYWFDRVRGGDEVIYRVYTENIIVPEALCYKAKADKRLQTCKVEVADPNQEYVVDAVLAEGEKDGEVQYLVKWKGYEADITDDNWLTVRDMKECKVLLKAWKRKGREEWLAACQRLKQEAGLDLEGGEEEEEEGDEEEDEGEEEESEEGDAEDDS